MSSFEVEMVSGHHFRVNKEDKQPSKSLTV